MLNICVCVQLWLRRPRTDDSSTLIQFFECYTMLLSNSHLSPYSPSAPLTAVWHWVALETNATLYVFWGYKFQGLCAQSSKLMQTRSWTDCLCFRLCCADRFSFSPLTALTYCGPAGLRSVLGRWKFIVWMHFIFRLKVTMIHQVLIVIH